MSCSQEHAQLFEIFHIAHPSVSSLLRDQGGGMLQEISILDGGLHRNRLLDQSRESRPAVLDLHVRQLMLDTSLITSAVTDALSWRLFPCELFKRSNNILHASINPQTF